MVNLPFQKQVQIYHQSNLEQIRDNVYLHKQERLIKQQM